MFQSYFKGLYERTMCMAYETAYQRIARSVGDGDHVLDCGANNGWTFDVLSGKCNLSMAQYHGIEWDPDSARAGRDRGLDIQSGDLNQSLPHESECFSCIYALSVLEHLLNPCRFIRESHRALKRGGRLVLLTPNISTYFTAALILMGKMPSSGPHPDSEALMRKEEFSFAINKEHLTPDAESDTPVHRHLVVFSYRVMRDYLRMVGFVNIKGQGFGLYPFPNAVQPLLERIDPYHCHQMVFAAQKPV